MNRNSKETVRLFGGLIFALSLATLAGCGGTSNSSGAGGPTSTAAVGGKVMGGRQPVVGANVYVYEAGLNPGDAPQQIGAAITDSRGSWSIANFSPIPANGQLIYIVATGGNPGAGINSQAVLMTVAGTYGSSNFPNTVSINELTSVASTSVLQNFITEVSCAGISGSTASGGNCPSINGANGLVAQANTLAALVDVSQGTASTFLTSAAGGSAINTTLGKLNSLASILATCVNSTGGVAGDGGACSGAFVAAGDPQNGTLTKISSVNSNGNSQGLAASPDGRYVFVVESGDIATFGVGSAGALSRLSSVINGNNPTGIAAAPGGQYVFVAESSGISTYSIGSGGALSRMSLLTGSNSPYGIAVSPDGKYVFSADLFSHDVATYSVGTGGALTQLSSVVDSHGTHGIAVLPDGQYAYVAENGSIAIYSADSSGDLTFLSLVTDSNVPYGLAASPNSQYLFVADLGGDMATYGVGSGGALTLLSSVNDGNSYYRVAVSPNGRYVFGSDTSGHIATYVVGAATDTLQAALNIARSNDSSVGSALFSQLPAPAIYSPILSSAPVNWIVGGQNYVFVSDAGGNINTLILSSGVFTNTSISISNGNLVNGLTVSANGEYAYAVDTGGILNAYAIDPGTGALALVNQIKPSASHGAALRSVAISPDSQYLFVGDANGYLDALAVSGANFTDSGATQPSANLALAVSADGRYAYSAAQSGYISSFSAASGALTFVSRTLPSPAAGSALQAVAVSANGKYVFVGDAKNKIDTEAVNNGAFTDVRSVSNSALINGLALSFDGQNLLSVDASGRLSAWLINGSAGSLTLQTSIKPGASSLQAVATYP